MEMMVGEAHSEGCEMELTSCFLDDGFGSGSASHLFLYRRKFFEWLPTMWLYFFFNLFYWNIVDLQKVRELCPPKFLSLVFRASTPPTMYSYNSNNEKTAAHWE